MTNDEVMKRLITRLLSLFRAGALFAAVLLLRTKAPASQEHGQILTGICSM